jgi:hypothetical protein
MAFFDRVPKQAFEAWNIDEAATIVVQFGSWNTRIVLLLMIYEPMQMMQLNDSV